jgi:hypothetical protein
MHSAKTRSIRPSVLAAVAALLASAAAGAWLLGLGPRPEPTTAPAHAEAVGSLPRIEWPAGERRIFRVRYESRDTTRPVFDETTRAGTAEPIESTMQLDATVAVTGEGEGAAPGSTRATFRVLSCEAADWSVAGGRPWPDARTCTAMLDGQTLGIEVSETGETLSVFDPPGAEPSIQGVLQALWLRLQAGLPDVPVANGDTYWAQEGTLQGKAAHVYRVRAGSETTLERQTVGYFDLRIAQLMSTEPAVETSGRARFTIDATSLLQSAEGEERLVVRTELGTTLVSSDTTFRFDWLRTEPATAPTAVADWTRRGATSALASAKTRERLLAQRVAGLDRKAMLATLRDPGEVGGPRAADFMWRATGLLELEPKAAWDLLPIARGDDASPRQRARALDLLTNVGHAEAQAVLRAALADADALAGGDRATRHLYQRLGLLDQPEPETAALVAEHYARFRAEGAIEAELTSAYSLGAITARLSRGDDAARALADGYNDRLVADLRADADPLTLQHRVTALGSTRRADNVPLFGELASHGDGAVRSRVATALGAAETTTPPDALLQLLGDEDSVVQRSAVRAASPDTQVYAALELEAAAGRIAGLNVRPVLDLVKAGRASHPAETAALLDVLIEAGIPDDLDRQVAYGLRAM